MEEKNHIYPIFDRMMTRQDKEELLGQHSVMIWFTGLSGSGKSTIAIALERELHKRGLLCRILDGDNIRSGINNNLGFSETDHTDEHPVFRYSIHSSRGVTATPLHSILCASY